KDHEELERLDRSRIEVVVSVLAVVEMKPAELAELDQPGNNHLDVQVRRVVPEVHEALDARAELARAPVAHTPLIDHGRIERGLVELVLEKQAPAVGQRPYDLAQAV